MRLIPILLALLIPCSARSEIVWSNTVAAAIGDSHVYIWPTLVANELGFKAFTNGAHGTTVIVHHTNNWKVAIRPWFDSFTNGETKILFDGGVTVDLINGITTVGGVTNYINIKSNMFEEALADGVLVLRPLGLFTSTNGWNVGSDNYGENLWVINNWYINNPRLVKFVPDFFRRLPDNSDPTYWPEPYHVNDAGEAIEADEAIRVLKSGFRPPLLTIERVRDRLEARDYRTGKLIFKHWVNGGSQEIRGSKFGTFNHGFVAGAGGHFIGIEGGGSPSLVLDWWDNQHVPVLSIGPTEFWHTGRIKIRGEPLDVGHVWVAPSGTVQFFGPHGEWYDMQISDDGGFAVYNVRSNYSKMFHVTPNGNATFTGSVTAKGFISTE